MGVNSEKDILKKYTRLRKRSRRIFGHLLGEDVAQESIIKFLEGKDVKQNDSYSLYDAARKSRSGTYHRRNGAVEPSQPNAEWCDTEAIYGEGSRADNESSERHFKSLFDFVHLISHLKKPKLIQIIILKDIYEWTLFEISQCFGVSESRISQEYTLSKKLLKKIAITQGLLPREQRISEQEIERVLSQNFKIIPAVQSGTEKEMESFQSKEIERRPFMGAQALFEIPKTIFSFTRKNEKEYQKEMPRMAKIKLEGKSIICPQVEKKTINFWPQVSNF